MNIVERFVWRWAEKLARCMRYDMIPGGMRQWERVQVLHCSNLMFTYTHENEINGKVTSHMNSSLCEMLIYKWRLTSQINHSLHSIQLIYSLPADPSLITHTVYKAQDNQGKNSLICETLFWPLTSYFPSQTRPSSQRNL